MEGLSIRNLSISFGGIQALRNVSLEIRPGEIVGLIGPNGAGKTSLINCISRYYRPSGGEILFDGVDLLRKKPHHLLDMGISRSFQELSLPPSLSVLDNVMLGQHSQIRTNLLRALLDFRYLKAEDRKWRKRARDTMRFFTDVRASSERSQEDLGFPDISGKGGYPDLLDVQDVPVGMLPYGIRKMVDLARAFVSCPRLLILDEPAAGLSSANVDELVNLMRSVQTRFNTSILLVEHHMPLVMSLCSRVVVLNFGEKIAEGTPQEIKRNGAVIEAYLGKSGPGPAGGSRSESKGARVAAVPAASDEAGASAPILEARKVDLHYGKIKALSGVSLGVAPGSITAILGSNGAGKSTLLKAISGIERLTNGEIVFQGERLCHYLQEPRPDRIVRKGVIHVAEGRRIFKELSVMENFRVAAYTLRSKRQFARNVEKVFHYFPKLKGELKLKDAGNLSGGLQQMVKN